MPRFGRCLLALLVLSILATGLVAVPAANAAECPAYEFIGARGSGESAGDYSPTSNYGMGDLVASVYRGITSPGSGLDPSQVAAYGVHYPAVGLTETFKDKINALGAALDIGFLGAYTSAARTRPT